MSYPLQGLPQAQYHSIQLAQVRDEPPRRRWAVVTAAGLGVVVVLGCLVLAAQPESTTSLLGVAATRVPTLAKPMVSRASQQAAPKAFVSGPRGSHALRTNVVRGSRASVESSSAVQANAEIVKALEASDVPVVPDTTTTTTSSASFLSNLMLGGMAAMMALAGLGSLLQRLVLSPRGMKFAAMAMDSEDLEISDPRNAIKAAKANFCDIAADGSALSAGDSVNEDKERVAVVWTAIKGRFAAMQQLLSNTPKAAAASAKAAAAVAAEQKVKQRKEELAAPAKPDGTAEIPAPAAKQDPARRAMFEVLVAGLSTKLGRDLRFEKDAGAGNFADVAIVEDVTGGRLSAVKFAHGDLENIDLLERESIALADINALEGSEAHVVQQLMPYTEFEADLGEGRGPVGAVMLERGECDLENFVKIYLGGDRPAGEEALAKVAAALSRWDSSIRWMHSHGMLHLDVKAENAVCFGNGHVKLIDLSGVVSSRNILAATDGLSTEQLKWSGMDMEKQDVPYVSTETYAQPLKMGPGGVLIDYSADWWSAGVSKLEVLGLAPEFFEGGANTAVNVQEALLSSELEMLIRPRLGELLGEYNFASPAVNRWTSSVILNLWGKQGKSLAES